MLIPDIIAKLIETSLFDRQFRLVCKGWCGLYDQIYPVDMINPYHRSSLPYLIRLWKLNRNPLDAGELFDIVSLNLASLNNQELWSYFNHIDDSIELIDRFHTLISILRSLDKVNIGIKIARLIISSMDTTHEDKLSDKEKIYLQTLCYKTSDVDLIRDVLSKPCLRTDYRLEIYNFIKYKDYSRYLAVIDNISNSSHLLRVSISYNNVKVVDDLLKKGAKVSFYHLKKSIGKDSMIRNLLLTKISPNSRQCEALFLSACRKGDSLSARDFYDSFDEVSTCLKISAIYQLIASEVTDTDLLNDLLWRLGEYLSIKATDFYRHALIHNKSDMIRIISSNVPFNVQTALSFTHNQANIFKESLRKCDDNIYVRWLLRLNGDFYNHYYGDKREFIISCLNVERADIFLRTVINYRLKTTWLHLYFSRYGPTNNDKMLLKDYLHYLCSIKHTNDVKSLLMLDSERDYVLNNEYIGDILTQYHKDYPMLLDIIYHCGIYRYPLVFEAEVFKNGGLDYLSGPLGMILDQLKYAYKRS